METLEVLAERVSQMDRRMEERFKAQEKVLDEKWGALGVRLETMNEFRSQLTSQAGSFVTWPMLIAACMAISGLMIGVVEVVLRAIH